MTSSNNGNKIQDLIVDTTAFIQNAPLQEIAVNIYTVQEVVDEIVNKRQLRRLVVLPYDLKVKDVFPENIKVVTDFSKKTGDYPSLSATDIKVMALTYQMEKEKVGTTHLRADPIAAAPVVVLNTQKPKQEQQDLLSGFYKPQNDDITTDKELNEKFAALDCDNEEFETSANVDDILESVSSDYSSCDDDDHEEDDDDHEEDDDDEGWITPSNVQKAKKQINEDFLDDTPATVACITTDFAMQNVLKQLNLHVAALDGRMIKQLRTFILRCYTCFKTTSLMEKVFCPKCGNKTLKKVAVSVDADGKQRIHINARRPLTAKGKKFSLPTFKGGKHANNPVLTEDQPMPQQRASRQARLRNNPLEPDYIAGYSPFVMRDVSSRSALLGIRPGVEVKYWMKKNPNEARRKRK